MPLQPGITLARCRRVTRPPRCRVPSSNTSFEDESLGKVLVGALVEDHQNDGSMGIQERNL